MNADEFNEMLAWLATLIGAGVIILTFLFLFH